MEFSTDGPQAGSHPLLLLPGLGPDAVGEFRDQVLYLPFGLLCDVPDLVPGCRGHVLPGVQTCASNFLCFEAGRFDR
ncbi:hypothetical protein B5P43_31175 [Bacillus sp. SRB_336]|nr:hypothetical protein B5P43_31175 [Bacillus sp. SRB_336]